MAVKVCIQVDHAYIKIKYILCIHLKNNVSCIKCKHKNICDFSVSICMHDYTCMHTFIFYPFASTRIKELNLSHFEYIEELSYAFSGCLRLKKI